MRMNLNNYDPICILGNPGTGKTNLAFYLESQLDQEKFPNRYTLGYPAKKEGFLNLSCLQDLARISDCSLIIDEIDRFIPVTDKKANLALQNLLKFAKHKRIKLIFNTQLSQFVSKTIAALVPQWAILNLDYFGLKNGSKPKRILQWIKTPLVDTQMIGMALPQGSFIWWDDNAQVGECGIKLFDFMHIGKDWGKTPRETKKMLKEMDKMRTDATKA